MRCDPEEKGPAAPPRESERRRDAENEREKAGSEAPHVGQRPFRGRPGEDHPTTCSAAFQAPLLSAPHPSRLPSTNPHLRHRPPSLPSPAVPSDWPLGTPLDRTLDTQTAPPPTAPSAVLPTAAAVAAAVAATSHHDETPGSSNAAAQQAQARAARSASSSVFDTHGERGLGRRCPSRPNASPARATSACAAPARFSLLAFRDGRCCRSPAVASRPPASNSTARPQTRSRGTTPLMLPPKFFRAATAAVHPPLPPCTAPRRPR